MSWPYEPAELDKSAEHPPPWWRPEPDWRPDLGRFYPPVTCATCDVTWVGTSVCWLCGRDVQAPVRLSTTPPTTGQPAGTTQPGPTRPDKERQDLA